MAKEGGNDRARKGNDEGKKAQEGHSLEKPDEIYLGRGKYIIKMLQKFSMMDFKPMTTPMITNLKKLRSSDSSLVDPTSYHKLMGSLMYLVITRLVI